MKIALAQINPTINDLEGNSEKILAFTDRAVKADCDLVVFPELSFCGYPPKDLLLNPDFVDRCLSSFNALIGKIPGNIGVLLGNIHKDSNLYNSAFFIYNGKVINITHKSLLPEYDVFDEKRYFTPVFDKEPLVFRGSSLGITLCEDIWIHDPDFRGKYSYDSVNALKEKGIDLLINMSASPFTKGKLEKRKRMLSHISDSANLPVIYVNTAGANDSLIFDGFSMVYHPERGLALQLKGFREDIGFFDTEKALSNEISSSVQSPDTYELILEALILGVKDYMAKTGFKMAVLGLSGGIDSALVAYIASKAIGSENVLAISMPSEFSSSESIEDAEELARNLGINFIIVPIRSIFESYKDVLCDFLPYELDTTYQNIQARIRGNILMAFSNREKRLVLTTGNKSEFSTGYSTLYGDMAGGLSVLSDVSKTDIYRIAEHINARSIIIPENIIKKPPSAELKPGQRDSDELPPYDQLDYLIEMIIEKNMQIKDLEGSDIPYETVKRFIQLFERAEFKRQQAPLGLKISSNAFGHGRRIPIAMKKSFD